MKKVGLVLSIIGFMVCSTILSLGIELFAPNFPSILDGLFHPDSTGLNSVISIFCAFVFVLVVILPLIGCVVCGILILVIVKNMDEIKLRLATESDAEEIHDLMKEVYDGLDDKSLYVCDDLMYVKKYIKTSGFGVVSCYNDKIVGSFICRYPHMHIDNLGRDINLDESELDKVVHMESCVVKKEYRGKHLQSKMLSFAEQHIDTSKYKYFLATVSPDNPASYKSFESCGYKLMLTKEKYGGLLRRIYLKKV